ncbi:MAG: hypothetical protein ABSC95_01290, partial [Acetobacteraceae bacterium]
IQSSISPPSARTLGLRDINREHAAGKVFVPRFLAGALYIQSRTKTDHYVEQAERLLTPWKRGFALQPPDS